mgnify:CR=1 FL=1
MKQFVNELEELLKRHNATILRSAGDVRAVREAARVLRPEEDRDLPQVRRGHEH